jgi:hypothetical protein
MSRLRRLAFVALLSGIAFGTMMDTDPIRAPITVDDYQVLSADFHVHTFLGDGGIAPWTMQRQAARVGLDVIAITNHNQTLAGRLGRWAADRSSGPMVLVGEEITGRDFHLIAVGIERPVDWDQPVRAAIADVHAQGGVAIAAHPTSGFAKAYDEVSLAELDGVESAYTDSTPQDIALQLDDFYKRTLAHNPQVAAIGSSDLHTSGPLGWCRTYLLVRERSKAGIIDAVRGGRTVGYCENERTGSGRLHGRPELVRLLEPHRDALAPPRESVLQLLATFVVWLGLLALAVVGLRT